MSIKHILEAVTYYFDTLNKSAGQAEAYMFSLRVFRKLCMNPLSKAEEFMCNSLIESMLNKKPPTKKKVAKVWDINIMLKYICSLPSMDRWSLRLLSKVCATLLMLATMRRKAEILDMDLKHLTWDTAKSTATFHLQKPVKNLNRKTRKHVVNLQQVHISSLNDANPKVNPVHILKLYIERTKANRKSSYLFVTTTKFEKCVAATMDTWIREMLKEAGINTGDYTPHSIRSASSSAAAHYGVPIDRILEKAGWTQPTSFINHYLKPIEKEKPPSSQLNQFKLKEKRKATSKLINKSKKTLNKRYTSRKNAQSYVVEWCNNLPLIQQMNRDRLRRAAATIGSSISTALSTATSQLPPTLPPNTPRQCTSPTASTIIIGTPQPHTATPATHTTPNAQDITEISDDTDTEPLTSPLEVLMPDSPGMQQIHEEIQNATHIYAPISSPTQLSILSLDDHITELDTKADANCTQSRQNATPTTVMDLSDITDIIQADSQTTDSVNSNVTSHTPLQTIDTAQNQSIDDSYQTIAVNELTDVLPSLSHDMVADVLPQKENTLNNEQTKHQTNKYKTKKKKPKLTPYELAIKEIKLNQAWQLQKQETKIKEREYRIKERERCFNETVKHVMNKPVSSAFVIKAVPDKRLDNICNSIPAWKHTLHQREAGMPVFKVPVSQTKRHRYLTVPPIPPSQPRKCNATQPSQPHKNPSNKQPLPPPQIKTSDPQTVIKHLNEQLQKDTLLHQHTRDKQQLQLHTNSPKMDIIDITEETDIGNLSLKQLIDSL